MHCSNVLEMSFRESGGSGRSEMGKAGGGEFQTWSRRCGRMSGREGIAVLSKIG